MKHWVKRDEVFTSGVKLVSIKTYTDFIDMNGLTIQDGDVVDIHQTVNGCCFFYIDSVEPLDIRYDFDHRRKYEYDKTKLLAKDHYTGESTFTIVSRKE